MNDPHISPGLNRFGETAPVVRGQPKPQRIGREAFETLMRLLAEESETPTTSLGVFVANSTKRALRRQIEAQFTP